MGSGKKEKRVKSTHRTLAILEYFSSGRGEETVMSISRSLGYPQSSTSELLHCMELCGYLSFDPIRRTFRLSVKTSLLGASAEREYSSGTCIALTADRVSKLVGQTIVLSTIIDYMVHRIYVVQGAAAGAVTVTNGPVGSLIHSAEGRLLLSTYNDKNIAAIVRRLNAAETNPDRWIRPLPFVDELRRLRRRKWEIEQADAWGGEASVSVLMPPLTGQAPLVLSALASESVVVERGMVILEKLRAAVWRLRPPQDGANDNGILPIYNQGEGSRRDYAGSHSAQES